MRCEKLFKTSDFNFKIIKKYLNYKYFLSKKNNPEMRIVIILRIYYRTTILFIL